MTGKHTDALVDGHYRAEDAGDIDAIVDGFVAGAEHDVARRPGDRLHAGKQIAAYYRALPAALRIERFEPVRRRHGARHVGDESVVHGTVVGRMFGLDGHGRRDRHVRLLHVFDSADGRIGRESDWLDVADLQRQLAGPGGEPTDPRACVLDDGWRTATREENAHDGVAVPAPGSAS